MSTTVSYKGNTIATLSNETKTLTTAGTWVEGDIVVTDSGGSGTASISVVDTTDSHGGTIREITALDISDTTAVASDVASGKYFYTASGVKTAGTASGGSSDTFAEICNGTMSSYESDVLEKVPSNVLRSISSITSIKIHNCQDISSYGLGGIKATVIALPEFLGNIYSSGYAFYGATSLTTVDIGTKAVRFYSNFFNGASALDTLILRKTSIITLHNSNAFNGTPFKSGGTGGTIYIPKSLYDHLGDGTSNDYQSASNWSVVHGYGTITWAKIEGSIYENQYADGTTILTS